MQYLSKLLERFLKLLPIHTVWQVADMHWESPLAAAFTRLCVITLLNSQAARLVHSISATALGEASALSTSIAASTTRLAIVR